MTPAHFEQLIFNDDIDHKIFAERISSLSEEQRQDLAPYVIQFYKNLNSLKVDDTSSIHYRRFVEQWEYSAWQLLREYQEAFVKVCLGLVGFGGVSEIKQFGRNDLLSQSSTVVKILIDRKPAWVDEWLDDDLNYEYPMLYWEKVLELIEHGVCSVPTCPGFYQMMVRSLWEGQFRIDEKTVPLSETLKENPFLVEQMWKLFEVDTQAFGSTLGCYEDGVQSWSVAIVKLMNEGVLDRTRLLNLSLCHFDKEFRTTQYTGLMRFFDALEPTPDELAQHQALFPPLLTHKQSSVAKFALKKLSELESKNRLKREACIEQLAQMLEISNKGNAASAIKFLLTLFKNKAIDEVRLAQCLCRALFNPLADVQAAALSSLGKLNSEAIDCACAGLEVSGTLALSNQDAWQALVKQKEEKVSIQDEVVTDAQVITSLAEHDSEQLALLGLDEYEINSILKPVAPVLPFNALQKKRLTPIRTLDALIKTLNSAMKRCSFEQLERVIDAISQISPEGNNEQVGALNDIWAQLNTAKSEQSIGWVWRFSAFFQAWLQRKIGGFEEDSNGRFYDIAQRLVKKVYQPTLAFPTDAKGWIDPIIWAKRINHAQSNNHQISQDDLALSLLRLGAEERTKAHSLLVKNTSQYARLCRFALGSEEKPEREDLRHYGLWLAAARCRSPHADWSALFGDAEIFDPRPNNLLPCQYEFYFGEFECEWGDDMATLESRQKFPTEQGSISLASRSFTHMKAGQAGGDYYYWQRRHSGNKFDSVRAVAKNLHNCDEFYLEGIEQLFRGRDEITQPQDQNYYYLRPLNDLCRRWSEPAYLLCALGLYSRHQDSRDEALEALSLHSQYGLLDSDVFAQQLYFLSQSQRVKPNRLGDALSLLLKQSPATVQFIADSLQRYLLLHEALPYKSYIVFEALLNSLISHANKPNDALNAWLSSHKASGKTEKLRKQLIGLKGKALENEVSQGVYANARLGLLREASIGSTN